MSLLRERKKSLTWRRLIQQHLQPGCKLAGVSKNITEDTERSGDGVTSVCSAFSFLPLPQEPLPTKQRASR